METNRDNNLAMIAALLVMFSALLDPRVTVVLALSALVVLLVSRLRQGTIKPQH